MRRGGIAGSEIHEIACGTRERPMKRYHAIVIGALFSPQGHCTVYVPALKV